MSRIRLTTLALAAIAICSGVLTASLLVPPADVTPIVVDNGSGNTESDTGAVPAGTATGGGTGMVSAAPTFRVSDAPGHPMSLRPGATQPQWVRLTNPNDVAIQVSTLSAAVGQPVDRSGRPMARCSAGAVTVTPLPVSVTVPPHGQVDTTLSVRMAPNTPAECQGASYPLSYTGSGKPELQLDRPGAAGSTPSGATPTSSAPASAPALTADPDPMAAGTG
jgi:hypothetical protein